MSDLNVSFNETAVSLGRQNAQLVHLDRVAEQIRIEVDKVEKSLRHSLKHAIIAGKILCEAKKLIGHGEWLAWFSNQKFTFAEGTAQRYMRLYRRWPEINDRLKENGNPSSLTDLTFSDAISILSDPERLEQKPLDAPNGNALLPRTANSGGKSKTPKKIVQSVKTLVVAKAWNETQDYKTPKVILNAAVNVLGEIDYEPTLTDATDVHKPWNGRVFLNPSHMTDMIDQFTQHLLAEIQIGNVTEAILLVPTDTHAKWYRRLNTSPRVLLAKLDEDLRLGWQNPLTAFYFGSREHQFFEVFQSIGDGYVPYRFYSQSIH